MFRLRGLEKYLACLSLFNKLLRSVVTGNGIGTMKPKWEAAAAKVFSE